MTGGNWSPTDKPVLPGLFMNFKAAALASIQPGARGVVIMPVKANWGPVRQYVEITSEAAIIDNFTADLTGSATAYNCLRLSLLGGAKKILAYRLADSAAAVATTTLVDTAGTPVNVLKLDSKYPTTRAFKVTVVVNPVDSLKKDIKLYEGTTLLKSFTYVSGTIQAAVDAINNDPANVWVNATKLDEGTGMVKDVATQAFTGGNAGITGVTALDYTNFLAAAETQEFNVLALNGISASDIQTTVVAWVSRVRSAGKGIIAVLGGSEADDGASDAVAKAIARSAGYNHEGVVGVGTGAIMDGVSYASSQVACYVAGLIAGQKLSESTTYAPSPFDDVTRRWTRSEQEAAVTNGVFIFFHDGRLVKALRGMNSLVTLRQGQNNAWKKIRAIRVMDAINSDLQRAAENSYIGKVNNTEEGRLTLIAGMKQYLNTLAMDGVIETSGYDVYLDPNYYGAVATLTPEPDQVFTCWQARLTDVVEQIFGTFVVY